MTSGRGAWLFGFVAGLAVVFVVMLERRPASHHAMISGSRVVSRSATGTAAELVGTVFDTKGHAVAGAAVIASTSLTDVHQQVTGSDGTFAFHGLSAAAYDVVARGGRLASQAVRATLGDRERVEVDLVALDSSIAGTVVDPSGAPIAGANVSAIREGGLAVTSFARDVTDPHGRFDLAGLEPGRYRITASRPGQQRDDRADQGIVVEDGAREATIVLAPGGTLTGRVLLDGAPMPYYGLMLTEHPELSFSGEPQSIRAADGRFALRGVVAGTWGVVLIGPGTARTIIEHIAIAPEQTVDLGDIAMSHGQRVSGIVRDAAGKPVAGATVSIGRTTLELSPLEQWFEGEFQTTTNAAGAYVFDGVAPLGDKRPAEIAATEPTRGASRTSRIPDGDVHVDLDLGATGGVDGAIVGYTDRSGWVHLRDAIENHAARVDATGAFHFDNILPGTYTLAMTSDPGRMGPPSVQVVVVAGARATAKLVMPRDTVSLVVKVTGGTCKGVMLVPPGDGVVVLGDQHAYASCAGDTAELARVAPGAYRICAARCAAITVATTPAQQTVVAAIGASP